MDTFAAFSTSPSAKPPVAGNTNSSLGGAAASHLGGIHRVGGDGGISVGADAGAPGRHGTISSPQLPLSSVGAVGGAGFSYDAALGVQPSQRPGSARPGMPMNVGRPSHAAQLPANIFSTSATQMPNHNDNLNPNLASQFGTFHVSASVEADRLDDGALDSITRTLSVLQGIADGRHLVQWADLLDPEQPEASAQQLNAALAKYATPVGRKDGVRAIAQQMRTPAHLAVVSFLDEPFKNEVRNLVLQELLAQLTVAGDNPMPLCAEMLAELARLKLVRLNGVAVTIGQFISQPEQRRAGLAVLGRMAAQGYGTPQGEEFLRAVQATKSVEQMLCELYRDPQYEYDVVAITRLLGGPDAENAMAALHPRGTLRLPDAVGSQHSSRHHTPAPPPASSAAARVGAGAQGPPAVPVSALQYVRGRDELVAAQADGVVVVWGSANPATVVETPKAIFGVPPDHLPVAMCAPLGGQFVAVASVPCPAGHPYAAGLAAAAAARKSRESSSNTPGPARPAIRLLWANDFTGQWSAGETIWGKESAVLTAVAALSSARLCAAEGSAAQPGLQSMRCIDARTTQEIFGFVPLHDDYVTVLTTCEDNEALVLSGSRDRSVKLWDMRTVNRTPMWVCPGTAPAAGSPPHANGYAQRGLFDDSRDDDRDATAPSTALGHTDTVSSIYSFRSFIFTGSLDGSMLIWDSRHLAAPVSSRRFPSGVLDITALEGGRTAVSTTRGLYLLSLETMGAVDVIPNVAYTKLRCNDTGSVVFAAGEDGLSLFSL